MIMPELDCSDTQMLFRRLHLMGIWHFFKTCKFHVNPPVPFHHRKISSRYICVCFSLFRLRNVSKSTHTWALFKSVPIGFYSELALTAIKASSGLFLQIVILRTDGAMITFIQVTCPYTAMLRKIPNISVSADRFVVTWLILNLIVHVRLLLFTQYVSLKGISEYLLFSYHSAGERCYRSQRI